MPTSIKPVKSIRAAPKKGRFRPRPNPNGLEPLQQAQIAKDLENESKDVSDRQRFCEEMLAQGYIQTFVDFFYLTHRPEPQFAGGEGPVPGSGENAQINVPPEEMSEIRRCLTQAEDSRRRGDTNEVFNAYAQIAEHFKTNDPKTSIYYHEKCLEIARLTGNLEQEMQASNNIGVIYQAMNDVGSAVRYHERHLEIAMENNETETQVAARELVKVYMELAKQHENEEGGADSGEMMDSAQDRDSASKAVRLYEKCLEAALLSGSRELEGMAGYRLGRTHLRLAEPEKAKRLLEQCLQIYEELEDKAGEG